MGGEPEGLARLAFLPAAPAEVPRKDTDTLAMRGMARVLAEDLAGAVADLSAAAARLRAGVPLRTGSLCLTHLALAEWRLGSWDDAVVHAELAVSLARDADRAWEFALVHYVAAVVPALRGEWETASAHVEMAAQAARATGAPRAIGAAATAEAFLAMARGDLEGVTGAAAAVRATGRAQLPSLLPYDWRSLEIEALIGLRPPRRGGGGAGRAGGGAATGRPAVGPGGRRPAARRPGRGGRAPGRRRRGVPGRLAPRRGPAGAAGPGPAGDLRRPPAARRRPAAAGRRPAALGPAAPHQRWAPGPTWRSATGSSPPPARPREHRPCPRCPA